MMRRSRACARPLVVGLALARMAADLLRPAGARAPATRGASWSSTTCCSATR